jgi:DNA-binding response OmpR family regulator
MTCALVVDDDADVLAAIGTWLHVENIEAVLAESASDGFRAFDTFSFDVGLVDIFMPKIDGLKAIRAFRERAPDLPLIVMSGLATRHPPHPAPDYFGLALVLGASCCLHKPFVPDELMTAIKTCLDASHASSEPAVGGAKARPPTW